MFGRNLSTPLFSLIPVDNPRERRSSYLRASDQGSEASREYRAQCRSPAHVSPFQLSRSHARKSRSPDAGPSSAEKFSLSDKRRLLWEKEIQPLIYSPPSETYYDSLPIKPGFFFLHSLLHAPHANIASLRVNLPMTLYFSDHLYLLSTSSSGQLFSDPEAHFITFLKQVESRKPQVNAHPFDQVATVLRLRSSKECDMKKFVMDWLAFRQKMLGHDLKQYAMMQEFVRSPGGKPAVVRLTYNVSTKQPRANTAYLISSKVHTSHSSDFLRKTVVDLSLPDSIEVFKQIGKALVHYESQAKNLVEFLQRGYRVRFEEIVLDFLKSSDGKVWFCGCKGFRLDAATVPEPIYMTETFSPFRKGGREEWSGMAKKKEEAAERLIGSFVTCKLCRVQYANHELPHLVSVKMLFLFRFHAMQRIHLPIETSHLKVTSQDLMSQSVRICACCFMVVTAEHALVVAERKLAQALNIPMKEEDITAPHKPSEQLQFLPKVLRQYRFLFHFERIDTGKTPIAKEKSYLHFNLRSARAIFALEKLEEIGGSKSYPISALRLVYVFSSQEKPLSSFLRKALVQVSVTSSVTPGSGEVYASGSSPLLQSFPVTTKLQTAFYTKMHLFLFDPSGKDRYPLALGVGFSCDHLFDPELLRVELAKHMDGYMPEDCYFNTDPLPKDWIYAFGEEPKGEDSFGQEVNPEDAYGPLINAEDLDRMQDITSPYPAPLNNKLVVSREKVQPSRSASLVSNLQKPPITSANSSLVTLDVTKIDPNTDSQIVDVLSIVEEFLTQKPQEEAGPALSSEKVRVLTMQRCCNKSGAGEGTKRTWSRLRVSSLTTRLHSEKSSTRSTSPKEAKQALSRQLTRIASGELGVTIAKD